MKEQSTRNTRSTKKKLGGRTTSSSHLQVYATFDYGFSRRLLRLFIRYTLSAILVEEYVGVCFAKHPYRRNLLRDHDVKEHDSHHCSGQGASIDAFIIH